jgi:ribosomal protein S18 acetylase RimI-like enzyme
LPSAPASASDSIGKRDSRISVSEAKGEDLDCPLLLDDYFRSAASGIGREIEITAMRSLLKKAGQESGWRRLSAKTQEGTAGCLLVENKPWDTHILAIQTKNITLLVNSNNRYLRREIAAGLLGSWLSEHATADREYFVVRIPADDVSLLHALEDRGFRVLVPMVTLGKNPAGNPDVVVPVGVEISKVQEQEVDQVEAIAAHAFRWGRFSADPGVRPDAAQTLHAEWASNCCKRSQAESVLVARRGHEVLGFIALKFLLAREARVGSVELIATSENARGLGVGRALLQRACNWFAQFTENVIVRTELPNTIALRLYESEGFRILNGSLYLSLWRMPEGSRDKLPPSVEA